jgi:hypothetical protein
MRDSKRDIAFWGYDRTQALADGRVKITGADAKFHSGRIEQTPMSGDEGMSGRQVTLRVRA